MRPKTLLQKEVFSLYKKLKRSQPVNPKQKSWFYKNCFEYLGIYSRKRIYCAECGEWTRSDGNLVDTLIPIECPSCKRQIQVKPLDQVFDTETEYGQIITYFHDFQIFRIFQIRKHIKKGQQATYSCREVIQHWINSKGQRTVVADKTNGMSLYYDQWCLSSDMQIRQFAGSYSAEKRDEITSDFIYPKIRYLPIVYRNGFTGDYYDIIPHYLIEAILSNPKAETLIKTGQVFLLKQLVGINRIDYFQRYWSSIKICIRNKYLVTDSQTWFDYIVMLEVYGKDLHNPKYICPANLKKAHDKYVDRQNKEMIKEKIQKLKGKIKLLQRKYYQDKHQFFNLEISDGEFRIEPLTTIKEFITEGMELHHCVFSSEYFNLKDSLLLSAKLNGKRIETVEVSLKSWQVVQSRGLSNKPTEYNERIVSLVNENMSIIRKALKNE